MHTKLSTKKNSGTSSALVKLSYITFKLDARPCASVYSSFRTCCHQTLQSFFFPIFIPLFPFTFPSVVLSWQQFQLIFLSSLPYRFSLCQSIFTLFSFWILHVSQSYKIRLLIKYLAKVFLISIIILLVVSDALPFLLPIDILCTISSVQLPFRLTVLPTNNTTASSSPFRLFR